MNRRFPVRLALVALLLPLALAAPPATRAAPGDASADAVLGVPNMTSAGDPRASASASTMLPPDGIVVDPSGRLYVADNGNNRVLSWPSAAAFTNGQAADRVIGQPDFATTSGAKTGWTGTPLTNPTSLVVDSQGNLYVNANGDVMAFAAPTSTGMSAVSDFYSSSSSSVGLAIDSHQHLFTLQFGSTMIYENASLITPDYATPASFYLANDIAPDLLADPSLMTLNPTQIRFDKQDNLYVVDQQNNRVLAYQAPLNADSTPAFVLGQLSLFTRMSPSSEEDIGLYSPSAVAVDSQGNVYVADTDNHRVLEYDAPFRNDTLPDRVIGQPDLTSTTLRPISADSIVQPGSLAVDANDNLYVGDQGAGRVLRYDRPMDTSALRVSSLYPAAVLAGGGAFTLTVNGSGFAAGAAVRWNGASRATTRVSANQLTIAVSAADIAKPGAISIVVANASGASSAAQTLTSYAANAQDAVAERVLGQTDMTHTQANSGGISAHGLNWPESVTVDSQSGRIYVADTYNHRILSWPSATTINNGQDADLVIGQATMSRNMPNQNGIVSASSLSAPHGLALDSKGNLYAADTENNRVLEYDAPLKSGMNAARVFGQPDMKTALIGFGKTGLKRPVDVALDAKGNLYVVDSGNARVIEYDAPLTSDTSADHRIGESSFDVPSETHKIGLAQAITIDKDGQLYVSELFTEDINFIVVFAAPLTRPNDFIVFGDRGYSNGSFPNSTRFYETRGLAVDARGRLYLADGGNFRVLGFDAPLSEENDPAERLFGQATFSSGGLWTSQTSASQLTFPCDVALDSGGRLYVADTFSNRIVIYDLSDKAGSAALPARAYLPFVRR